MTSGSADHTPSERERQASEPTTHERAAGTPTGATARSTDAAAAAGAPREGQPAPTDGAAGEQPPQQREDYGPLELLRTRKRDERALLLFSHRREERGK